ncbi:MAG: carboxypeptidase-like regulatory domain-containing protein [Cyclobacteriaceae bacterium]
MKKTFFLFILLLGLLVLMASESLFAQQRYTVSGIISDVENGERLAGATIRVVGKNIGVTSNSYGFYSITVAEQNIELHISYIGYAPQLISLKATHDQTLNIELKTDNLLEEIVIRESPGSFVDDIQMGKHSINPQIIRNTPAFFGEPDIMRTMQLLPGISRGQEGSADIFVRGGSPDQNLILLDGVPVYNVNHLFGFLSVFNTDAIKDVTMMKGGIPARYGGRLSSLMNITMKEGNNKSFKGTYGISPFAAKLTLEAPIVKEKASFMVSGRRSFLGDLLAFGDQRYSFYDINAKVNAQINDKNTVYLSYYTGRDGYINTMDGQKYDYNWGNNTAVIRWNSILSSKVFGNFSAYFSKYDINQVMKFKDNEKTHRFESGSALSEWSLNGDFDWQPSQSHVFRFGYKVAHLRGEPEISQIYSSEEIRGFTPAITNAINTEIYVEDAFQINDALTVKPGIRYSMLSLPERTYHNAQPRFGASYKIKEDLAIKASYNYMVQYLHMLSNSTIGLPTDMWLTVTEDVRPQLGWQVATGISKSVDKMFEVSLELYYKEMNHILEFRDGSNFMFGSGNENWQDQVTSGSGQSYGAEFFVNKPTGKITGWFGYTLAWAFRTFPEIDNGQPFPFRYDRRHDLSLVGNYHFTPLKSFNIAFVYNTGDAISLPTIMHQGVVPPNWSGSSKNPNYMNYRTFFGHRNSHRMPSYHRLDIGYRTTKIRENDTRRTWTISVYNAYNRLNPYFIHEDQGTLKQVAIFPILPSLSYQLEF